MTDLVSFRTAVAAGVATAVPALLESKTHGGRFDAKELMRWSAQAPGARTCVAGTGGIAWQGGQKVVTVQMGTYLYAKGRGRDTSVLGMVNQLLAELPKNDWGITSGVEGPDLKSISSKNLYSSGSDGAGVSLWAVTWRQRIDIDVLDPATLDAFVTMQTEYDLGGDELDNTETTTTLEQDP